MKILFLTRNQWPIIGGVEKHVYQITKNLEKNGFKVTTISEKNINYPHIKFLGLIYIWCWLFKNRKIILSSDVVHIHDVFIWYLPFRFLYPFKKVYTTFHGWEEIYPIPFINKIQKQLAAKLSYKTISIGKYISKYYNIKSNVYLYGGISKNYTNYNKINKSILYVGRLEEKTGLGKYLEYLKNEKYSKVDFVGDGRMRGQCEKFGIVHGFTDPTLFYKKSETVVPSGYLTYLEAKSYGAKIKTFYSTPLKKDYWDEILKLKKFMTWDDVTNEYLNLWKS